MSDGDQQAEQTVEITTLLGKGAHFDGKLTFEGTVRIDGDFSGRIESEDILVVGEGGHLKAELLVGSVIIEGFVEGDIRATRSVEIHTPGRVKGNIVTPSLFIDRGVIFEGSCQMVDEPAQPETQTITAEPPSEDEASTTVE